MAENISTPCQSEMAGSSYSRWSALQQEDGMIWCPILSIEIKGGCDCQWWDEDSKCCKLDDDAKEDMPESP